MKWTRLCW